MSKFHNKLEEEFTSHPSKYPQRNFKDKACRWCGNNFPPTGPSHHYCSDFCRKYVYADKHYRRKYGIGMTWVLNKLQEQDHKCAICKQTGFKMKDTHITGINLDHCHSTGYPRGLLCHNCNRALGLFQDNPEYLRTAADYLEENYEPIGYEEFTPGGAEEIIREIGKREEEGKDNQL